MKIFNILFTPVFLFWFCLPVIADDDDTDLMKITVTGTRTEKNVDDIPASITVIDLEDSRQLGTSEFKDLIKYEPGIYVYDPRIINYSNNMTRGYSRGSASSGNVNIRGMNKNRVLMQQDGINLPAGFYMLGFDYSNGNAINYCSLSQVDVLKGSASVLYGSDALGGVVSFKSIAAEDLLEDGQSFKIEAPFYFNGSNQGTTSSIRLAGISEEIGLSLLTNLCINHSKEVKPSGADDKYINDADFKSDSIFLNVTKKIDDENKVSFYVDKLKKDSEIDSAEGNIQSSSYLSQRSEVTTNKDRYLVSWDYKSLNDDSFFESAKAKVYYQNLHTSDIWLEVKFEDIILPRVSDYHLYDEAHGFQIQFGSDIKNHLLTYGIDYSSTKNEYFQDKYEIVLGLKDRSFDANTGTYPIKRSPDSETIKLGLFLQDEISLGEYDITAGIRFDNYKLNAYPDAKYTNYCEGIGTTCQAENLYISNISPKIGVMRELNKDLKIWGKYSRGFKAPTWWELQSNHSNLTVDTPYRSIPNPDIKPENSDGFEIGIKGNYQKYNFDLIGFYNIYSDLLVRNKNDETLEVDGKPTLVATYQYANQDKARIWGVEMINKYKFTPNKKGFTFKSGAAFTHGQDLSENKPLNTIDPFKVIAGLEYASQNDKFFGEIIGTYVGTPRRERIPNSVGQFNFLPKPYFNFDFLTKYKYSNSIDFSFGLYNIFNNTYYILNNVGERILDEGIEQFAEPGRHFRVGFKFIF